MKNKKITMHCFKSALAVLIISALFATILSACGGGQPAPPIDTQRPQETQSPQETENVNNESGEMADSEIIETALLAYEYALPLVMVDLTKKSSTNMNPARPGAHAPVNQFVHARRLLPPEEKTVVRLNADTLYSFAFLQIFDEPVIMEKPKTDVYCSASILNAYTNSAAVLGTGGMDNGEAAVYAFCKPNFDGELPEGVIRIDVSTDIVWLMVRTRYEAKEGELEKIHAIQDQFSLVPLSEYGNEDYVLPEGSFHEDYVFVPLQKLFTLSVDEFFSSFNNLAVENPSDAVDAPYLEEFAKIGVGAGLDFSLENFSDEVQAALSALPEQVKTALMNNDPNAEDSIYNEYFHFINNWMYPDSSIANFGTAYDFRALVAVTLLGANPVEMAVYPGATIDSDNNPLDGNNNYTIRFEEGQFPPIMENGFWSITLYDESGFLHPNQIEKQAIRNIDDFIVDSDGAVTFYLQNESPGNDLEANWLPAPKAQFTLTLRIYLPDESVTNFAWEPPFVEIVIPKLNQ
ncbi:MAG: DUF1214 domain-containing protein [Oscillospiraceae bacterium]|nr:DUF1214 domain-containing protein [Oscillospiraceae bacterium]